MSEYEGLPLKTMNPFSNNKPRLTASERIRNKRDATIYNAEKQKFQESKKYNCTKGGVKFYKNGKIKSMISYKLQKSLARGSILCEDCNDKGLLCKPPDNKDGLGKINMGNNIVSEFWGGGSFEYTSGNFQQKATENTFLISDISGSWVDSSSNSKAIIGPSGTIGPINIPFGYGRNFIKIPRNLNGSGVVLDPSDQLFPNDYCDLFRFMNFGHLKTYLVLTMAVPVKATGVAPGPVSVKSQPDTCESSLNQVLVNSFLTIEDANGTSSEWFTSGQVDSLCCVGTFNLLKPYLLAPDTVSSGSFGLFDVYINLFSVTNWDKINILLNDKYELASDGTSKWNEITDWDIVFKKDDIYTLPFAFVRKIKLIQGTIPPSKNQTLYNSTQQSYMSCLENGTRKINFTKQNTRIPVTNAFCTPCVSVVTFTIQQQLGSPLPEFVNLSDGKYLLFDIGSNTNTTWNFNIINILDSCTGEAGNLKIDYLVVGGGGSGGSYGGGGGPSVSTTGGGGGGEVRTGSFDITGNSSFKIEVGRGDDPTGALAAGALNWNADYDFRFSSLNSPYDASGSSLTVTDIATSNLITNQNASFGQHGANTTGRKGDTPIQTFLRATDGGASGLQAQSNGGSVLNPDPSGTTYQYSTVPQGTIAFNAPANGFIINMRGSAGGGSNAIDGGDSGGTDCSGNQLGPNNFLCSGGNGANGVVSSITGTTQYYGAGGGGAAIDASNFPFAINAGVGGLGGGGDGAYKDLAAGGQVLVKGNNGTGYGAGGGGSIFTDVNQAGGNGYRGVVILKFYNAPA